MRVANERDAVGDGIECPLQTCSGSGLFRGAAPDAPGRGNAVCGPGQVQKVSALGVIELQRPCDRIENGRRGTADGTAFESGVILTLTPASKATSLRRRPATRRFRPAGRPAASGVSFARREVRNARTSALLSISLP